MVSQEKALILQFPTPGPSRGRSTRGEKTASVVPLEPEAYPDASRNAKWDRLSLLALDAWCWRDPESLRRLEAAVKRLQRTIAREWC
jgi:hypothetical protein